MTQYTVLNSCRVGGPILAISIKIAIMCPYSNYILHLEQCKLSHLYIANIYSLIAIGM